MSRCARGFDVARRCAPIEQAPHESTSKIPDDIPTGRQWVYIHAEEASSPAVMVNIN
jgi:hypothetical protein